ncbi:heterokaryon incompatibility protein-domain-containing protein [Exophiala viscosa]|uniref:heterokaryon incompatibility protein-domain-containing protein n=1 Tax=Exophiala viscosa TaxID=2486360 RepID=UPI00219C7BEE|nr:heterokaryon incompatibility protein-domain-containing protein [Exophiala viscosa]
MSVHSIGASEPRPTVMSLSETRVAYPKLLTGSQTRLVHIQHGSSSSNFVASLEVVDLDIDTRSSYDALSYHCGDMTAVSQVHLPDLDIYLPIARNLTDALNRVLKDGIPGPFWIDAISINQIDIEERNQQVRLMTRIFRGARQVFSWLGPDDEKRAILKAFYGRPYFRRAWVVQEIIVAREIHVLCGALPSFDFEVVFAAAWWLSYIALRQLLEHSVEFTRLGAGRVLYLRALRQQFQEKGAASQAFFDTAWFSESSDPRDKFFATQGIFDMSNAIKHHFEVDYRRPSWFVCGEAIRGIIKASRSLYVLSITKIFFPPDPSFPSWVPRFDGKADDFASHPEREAWTPDLSKISGRPHASPGTEPCLRETGQHRVLSLLGIKHQFKIAKVIPFAPQASPRLVPTLSECGSGLGGPQHAYSRDCAVFLTRRPTSVELRTLSQHAPR